MIEILDKQLFGKVITNSISMIETNPTLSAGDKKRFINAIGKASARMELFSDYIMDWDAPTGTMTIWNVGGNNKVYSANGHCQCESFKAGQICWHRTAAKLFKRYLEAINSPLPAPATHREMDTALYAKPQVASTKIGGFRI